MSNPKREKIFDFRQKVIGSYIFANHQNNLNMNSNNPSINHQFRTSTDDNRELKNRILRKVFIF